MNMFDVLDMLFSRLVDWFLSFQIDQIGVDSVEVELEMEKVTVIGYVDRNKVLKAVRRAGKRAEFWPFPNPPLYFTSSSTYFKIGRAHV